MSVKSKEYIGNVENLFDPLQTGNLKKIISFLDKTPSRFDYCLSEASRCGHVDVARHFLDLGADVHSGNDYSFIIATQKGHLETAKLLLDRGADIHARGDEALRRTAENGCIKTVLLLLDRGADYNSKETQKFLRKILRVKRIPESREELKNMLGIVSIHKE